MKAFLCIRRFDQSADRLNWPGRPPPPAVASGLPTGDEVSPSITRIATDGSERARRALTS